MELFFLAFLVLAMMFSLGSGFPVAFSLPGSAILTIGLAAAAGWLFAGNASAYFPHGTAVEWLTAGVTNFRGVYWEADRDTLIAIPLFVFMGIMLQRSEIAEELLMTMAKLFGGLPGGLGISVVAVGALLAATTGIIGATVVAMGLISLPAMLRSGYNQSLATGTVMAAGTLGQIIPPSIVLIILADQLSTAVDQAGQMRLAEYRQATGQATMPSELSVVTSSAGDLFMGALVPGLILVGLYILYVVGYALLWPKSAPAVPHQGRMDRAFWLEVFFAIVPPMLLIILVLGSIIGGIATVTQAGAVGAAGATVMAGYKLYDGPRRYWPAGLAIFALAMIWLLYANYNLNIRQIDISGNFFGVYLAIAMVGLLVFALVWSTWRTLKIDHTLHAVMLETARTSSMVFIILLGAAMLIAVFRAFGGEHLVRDFLTGLPGGFWGQFIIVMVVIFVLGFFLDFIEIAIVVMPIVAPILLMNPEANVSAIWLGVMVGINIQTSFLTPPFGFALFYLRGVADRTVKTLAMYRGVVPYVTLQLVALSIVGFFPPLANYVPARVSLLSENAPPPRNPRLQYCIEEILSVKVPAQEATVRRLVGEVRAADTGVLPSDRARSLEGALDGYEKGFPLLAVFEASRAQIADLTPSYRPLHREVSAIRREVERLSRRIERQQRQLLGHRGDTPEAAAERERINARIAVLRQEIDAARARTPEQWEEARGTFQALNRAELEARRNFRAATEPSYAVLRDMTAAIAASAAFAGMVPAIEALAARVGQEEPEILAEELRELDRQTAALAGSEVLRGAMTDLRNALQGRRASTDRATEEASRLAEVARTEAAWRARAQEGLLPAITALEVETRDTLGQREQPRLERISALQVAGCLSHHRDISLSF